MTPSVKSHLFPKVDTTSGEQNSAAIGTHHGLQPSSARLLRDLNNSARSSLLSSLGTAASRTFRSYKMTLPRCPPPVKTWNGSTSSIGGSGSARSATNNNNHPLGGAGGMAGSSSAIAPTNGTEDNEDEMTLESDLELLGRTVHAVSSALTEPPKENDRFMIYDVSFNPKGCVWDALIVVQLKDEEEGDNGEDGNGNGGAGGDKEEDTASHRSSRRRERSTSRNRRGSSSSRHRSTSSRSRRSTSRSKLRRGGSSSTAEELIDGKRTFSFPIRVTCAEDDYPTAESIHHHQQQHYNNTRGRSGSGSSSTGSAGLHHHHHPKRAKTYAVDLAVIDDMPHHPKSSWSTSEAAEHRDDIKNAMEWVSYGIRRSMARSMFPQFPEGCQGRPFREIYQLNKKVSVVVVYFVV